jgi:membrane protease YdiL (CAAX protease family)
MVPPVAGVAMLDPGLVVAVAVLIVFPLVRDWDRVLALLLAALAVVEYRRGNGPVLALTVFSSVFVAAASVPRLMMLWPLPIALGAAALAIATRTVPSMAGAFSFVRRGRLDAGVRLAIVASAIVAGAALVSWFRIARPDYTQVRRTLFPPLPLPLLAVGILAFAVVNGALEELAYRGVLLEALDTELGAPLLAIGVQALAFGAMHVNGFPRGLVGVALATIYGVMMGIVRRRADGLVAPFLAHVLTDVTIGTILLVTK